MGAELRDHRRPPPGLARVQADVQRTVDAGEVRLSESSPSATRFRRAGRGRVEVITFKPLSKNPGALQSPQPARQTPPASLYAPTAIAVTPSPILFHPSRKPCGILWHLLRHTPPHEGITPDRETHEGPETLKRRQAGITTLGLVTMERPAPIRSAWVTLRVGALHNAEPHAKGAGHEEGTVCRS